MFESWLAPHPLSELYKESFRAYLARREPDFSAHFGELSEALAQSLLGGAEDIHVIFTDGGSKAQCAFRADGALKTLDLAIDGSRALADAIRLSKTPERLSDEFFKEPLDFSIAWDGGGLQEFSFRFRAASCPLKNKGVAMALRWLPSPRLDRFQAALERGEIALAAPAEGDRPSRPPSIRL